MKVGTSLTVVVPLAADGTGSFSATWRGDRLGETILVSDPENGKVSVWGFKRDLRLVALPQTGDLPTAPLTDGNRPVLGSAGLMVSNADGTRFWLGTPAGS